MKILGFAGLVVALAILGYLILGYLSDIGKAQDAIQALPGSPSSQPADLTKEGLKRGLSPILDRARERVDETNSAAGR